MTSLLTTTLIVGPFAFPGSAGPSCSSPPSQEWVSLTPGFTTGSADILDYSVSSTNPDLIYVANELTVRASRDGGCSFTEVFNLGSADLSYDAQHASIKELEVAWAGGERVIVALEAFEVEVPDLEIPGIGEVDTVNEQHAVPRPRIVTSSDRGASWQESDQGLDDATGPPVDLSVGGAGSAVYLLLGRATIGQPQASAWTGQRLYGSSDGAANWSQRSQFDGNGAGQAVPPLPVAGIEADPAVANEVWAFGPAPQGLSRSTDGGVTFAANLTLPGQSIGGISIFRKAGQDPAYFTWFSDRTTVARSSDGNIFEAVPVRDIVTSGMYGEVAGELGFSTRQGHTYYVIPGVAFEIDISDPTKSIQDLQGSFAAGKTVIFGRTLRTLERRAEPPRPPEDPGIIFTPTIPPPPIPPGVIDKLKALGEPRLVPEEVTIELQPGESEVVRFYLQMPGVRKVDVVYLIDMSSSMGDEIAGLVTANGNISNELINAGFHAYFGVAGYRSYEDGLPYRRYRDVLPPDGLSEALGQMSADGGGQETATAALYQIATGDGQDDGGSAFIPAGQQMNFRPDALHLIVHGTDEELLQVDPRPSFEEAASALRGVRALQAGLAFRNSEQDPRHDGPPLATLQEMARLTGALAPTSGVDCGNGNIIAPGEPLVCEIPDTQAELAENMGAAIVEIVKGLEDRRDVSLEVSDEDGTPSELVDAISPFVWPAIDFKLIQQLPYDVTVSCPAVGEHELDVAAKARGVVLGSSTLNVICRDAPAAGDESPLIVLPLPPPPVPRPPQFNSPYQYSQNPVTQAQAQAQSQSQAQAQAGLVMQRQEQAQVAVVHSRTSTAQANTASSGSNGSGKSSDDMMMARYTPRKSTGIPLYYYIAGYALAGAICTSFAFAMRPARTQVRVRRRLR